MDDPGYAVMRSMLDRRCPKGGNRVAAGGIEWDLAPNRNKPTFILSHYNLLARDWNARFDTTMQYVEYGGMAELRRILEESGNVIAVINGHVHANRVEVRRGIHYIDVGATLVGPPSIRYFYVFPDSVVVTYDYISDCSLFNYAVDVASQCTHCFDPEVVSGFIDGERWDKEFTIPIRPGIRRTGARRLRVTP
jgi:hypothetical protein